MTAYCEGGGVAPLPLGEAAGGQGVPDGVVPVPGCDEPGLLPALFPAVEGAEFDDPDELPGVAVPGCGADPLGVPAVPGKLPQGDPLGVVPGAVPVFGFTVDGCVLLPGVGGVVEFDPGTLPACPLGAVPGCACGVAVPAGGVAVPAGGVAVLAGGVAVLAGGVAVLAGGVAVPAGGVADRGAELCPADPPAGAPCATAQAAHRIIKESSGAFFADISCLPLKNPDLRTWLRMSRAKPSLMVAVSREYPADAVEDRTIACTNIRRACLKNKSLDAEPASSLPFHSATVAGL